MPHRAFTVVDVITGLDEKVASITYHGDYVYVGGQSGKLLQYKVTATPGPGGRTEFKSEKLRVVEVARKAVTHLAVIPDQNVLLALADGSLCVYEFDTLKRKPGGSLDTVKGVQSFTLNVRGPPRYKLVACVSTGARKFRLHTYEWENGKYVKAGELEVPSAPRVMVCVGRSVFLGYTNEYNLLYDDTGEVTDLSAPLGKDTRPFIKYVPGDKLLVFAADGMGITLRSNGDLAPDPPTQFAHSPTALAFCYPYTISGADNSSKLEVHTNRSIMGRTGMERDEVVQTIELGHGTGVTAMCDGRVGYTYRTAVDHSHDSSRGRNAVYMALACPATAPSPSRIVRLVPVPVDTQVTEMIRDSQVDAAVELLTSTCPADGGLLAAKLSRLHIDAGRVLFLSLQFDTAFAHLTASPMDPREVLAMFPSLAICAAATAAAAEADATGARGGLLGDGLDDEEEAAAAASGGGGGGGSGALALDDGSYVGGGAAAAATFARARASGGCLPLATIARAFRYAPRYFTPSLTTAIVEGTRTAADGASESSDAAAGAGGGGSGGGGGGSLAGGGAGVDGVTLVATVSAGAVSASASAAGSAPGGGGGSASTTSASSSASSSSSASLLRAPPGASEPGVRTGVADITSLVRAQLHEFNRRQGEEDAARLESIVAAAAASAGAAASAAGLALMKPMTEVRAAATVENRLAAAFAALLSFVRQRRRVVLSELRARARAAATGGGVAAAGGATAAAVGGVASASGGASGGGANPFGLAAVGGSGTGGAASNPFGGSGTGGGATGGASSSSSSSSGVGTVSGQWTSTYSVAALPTGELVSLAIVLDTALLRLLHQACRRKPLDRLVFASPYLDTRDAAAFLKATGEFESLALLYCGRGLNRRALRVWRLLATGGGADDEAGGAGRKPGGGAPAASAAAGGGALVVPRRRRTRIISTAAKAKRAAFAGKPGSLPPSAASASGGGYDSLSEDEYEQPGAVAAPTFPLVHTSVGGGVGVGGVGALVLPPSSALPPSPSGAAAAASVAVTALASSAACYPPALYSASEPIDAPAGGAGGRSGGVGGSGFDGALRDDGLDASGAAGVDGTALVGVEDCIQLLRREADASVVRAHAEWLLVRYPDAALAIFTQPLRPAASAWHHDDVVEFLSSPSMIAAARRTGRTPALQAFLEHVVYALGRDEERYHTRLALEYTSRVITLRGNREVLAAAMSKSLPAPAAAGAPGIRGAAADGRFSLRDPLDTAEALHGTVGTRVQPGEEGGELGETRARLLRLLQQSPHVDAARLLVTLRGSGLHEETAVLHARRGDHASVLRTLVIDMGDHNHAVRYCELVSGDAAGGGGGAGGAGGASSTLSRTLHTWQRYAVVRASGVAQPTPAMLLGAVAAGAVGSDAGGGAVSASSPAGDGPLATPSAGADATSGGVAGALAGGASGGGGGGSDEAFVLLLNMYLQADREDRETRAAMGTASSSSSSAGGAAGVTAGAVSIYLTHALELLTRHAGRISPLAVANMLPTDLPLHMLQAYWTAVIPASSHAVRSATVARNLLRFSHLEASASLATRQTRCLEVNRTTWCFVCDKRIGDSVFALLPDNRPLHFGCLRELGNTYGQALHNVDALHGARALGAVPPADAPLQAGTPSGASTSVLAASASAHAAASAAAFPAYAPHCLFPRGTVIDLFRTRYSSEAAAASVGKTAAFGRGGRGSYALAKGWEAPPDAGTGWWSSDASPSSSAATLRIGSGPSGGVVSAAGSKFLLDVSAFVVDRHARGAEPPAGDIAIGSSSAVMGVSSSSSGAPPTPAREPPTIRSAAAALARATAAGGSGGSSAASSSNPFGGSAGGGSGGANPFGGGGDSGGLGAPAPPLPPMAKPSARGGGGSLTSSGGGSSSGPVGGGMNLSASIREEGYFTGAPAGSSVPAASSRTLASAPAPAAVASGSGGGGSNPFGPAAGGNPFAAGGDKPPAAAASSRWLGR